MKLVKPSWVFHPDPHPRPNDAPRKLPIYSLAVHPDASRLATAGLDGKIRIWSTLPILSPEVEANPANARLLCTMTQHDGSVLCVRWAGHGRYLASGSDDHILLIWDLDRNGGGRVFGSTDVNVESWKPLVRLVGHSSDVVDLAWSPDDSLLASVGLDSTIIVWCTRTFRPVVRIEGHHGYVKGVCWDPAGEFLATQSDDKTVKIWRTADWGLAATVAEPFKNSPGSTFFRRLSWSPDGAFIASSNAMNNAVFTAAVIERAGYKQDVSFVGHVDTIEVTAFNPRILHPPPPAKPSRKSVQCILALGSDDRSISIWGNKSRKPLVVVREVFDGRIWDLSWTKDGRTLWAAGADGTVVCLGFEEGEVEGFAEEGVLQTILETYPAFANRSARASADPLSAQPSAALLSHAPLPVSSSLAPSPSASQPPPAAPPLRPGQAPPLTHAAPVPLGPAQKQDVSLAKNGKKRIRPTTLGGGAAGGLAAPSALFANATGGAGNGMASRAGSALFPEVIRIDENGNRITDRPRPPQPAPAPPARLAPASAPAQGGTSSATSLTPLASDASADAPAGRGAAGAQAMDVDAAAPPPPPPPPVRPALNHAPSGVAPSWTVDSRPPSREPSAPASGKRKPSEDGASPVQPTRVKGRTLGEGVRRASGPVGDLRAAGAAVDGGVVGAGGAGGAGAGEGGGGDVLPRLGVKSVLRTDGEDGGEWIEARNSLTGPTEVIHHTSSQVSWLDYLPSPVISLVLSSLFAAFASDDGTLSVYSPQGRRVMPVMVLDGPAVRMFGNGKSGLGVVTSRGTLYEWNLRTRASTLGTSPTPNVTHLAGLCLPGSGGVTVQSAQQRPNGRTVLVLGSGHAVSWSAALGTWTVLASGWHRAGSPLWDVGAGRVRSSTASSSKGVVAQLEASLSELPLPPSAPPAGADTPDWWAPALALSHLEFRLLACSELGGSGDEYRRALRAWAEKVAEEGFRAKGEELVKELVGPAVSQYPALASASARPPPSFVPTTICGVSRRDLLKDVLSLFARSTRLAKLGMDWQEIVRRAVAAEKEREDAYE